MPREPSPVVFSSDAEELVVEKSTKPTKMPQRNDEPSLKRKLPTGWTQRAPRKIMSWNARSLNARIKNSSSEIEALVRKVNEKRVDLLLVQETHMKEKNKDSVEKKLRAHGFDAWEFHWNCGVSRPGIDGVLAIVRQGFQPLAVSKSFPVGLPKNAPSYTKDMKRNPDTEGRTLILEYPEFWVVNTYVPSCGVIPEDPEKSNLNMERRKIWDARLQMWIQALQRTKPCIWAGDLNVSHKAVDIAVKDPAMTVTKGGCCLNFERKNFSKSLTELNLVDTFRHFHPAQKSWTWSTANGKKGMRLDYFLVNKLLMPRVSDSVCMVDKFGSDHMPIVLTLTRNKGGGTTKRKIWPL